MGRSLRWLWIGQLLSNLGTQASLYGLGVWLLQQQQMLRPLVVVALAVQLAKVAVLPLVGPRLQRWPRRGVMLLANSVAAAATFCLAALLVWSTPGPAVLVLLLAVAAAAEAVLVLAIATLIPLLVPPAELPRLNGWLVGGDALVSLAAPALGAALVATAGVPAVVGLDAATFAVGLICVASTALPAQISAVEPGGAGWRWLGFRASGRQLWRQLNTRRLLAASMVQSFVLACTEVLFPAWVLMAFGPAWLAPALLLNGLAYGLGTLLWQRLGDRRLLLPALMGLQALMLLGAGIPRIAQLPPLWAAGVVSFTTAVPILLAALQGRWQRLIPPRDQPRCFAVRFSGEWLARLLGLLSTAALVDGLLRGSIAGAAGLAPAAAAGAAEALALAAVGGLLLAVLPWLR